MKAVRSAATLFAKLLRQQKGATAIEYGLIASLIVVAMIASFRGVASVTTGLWNNTATAVREASK